MSIQYFHQYNIPKETAPLTASVQSFCDKLKSDKGTYYELTGPRDAVTNLYFDIDMKDNTEFESDITKSIEDLMKKAITHKIEEEYNLTPNLIMATSHGATEDGFKCSCRFFVTNIRDRKDSILKFVQKFNLDFANDHDCMETIGQTNNIDYKVLDESVYSHNRKMRCVGTSKPGESRPLVLKQGKFEDSLITYAHPDSVIKHYAPSTPEPTIISSSTQQPIDDDELIEQYRDYMALIKREHFSEYKQWFSVQRASANMRIPFDVYDSFMRGTRNYDRSTNFEYYQRPDTAENKLGFSHIKNIAYEYKPHEKMELDKKWCSTNVAETDLDAAKIILKRYKRVLKSYKGRIFLKENNIWIADSQRIEDTLLKVIMNSGITKGKDKNGKDIEFVKNYSAAEKVKKSLVGMIRLDNDDPSLYDKFHSTMKGAFCFQDGVLNFQTKSFELWSEIPADKYHSTIQIPRKYADYFANPDKKMIEKVKSDVFETLYADKTDTALQFLSRAAAGHCEDKNWAFYLGNRNCGKGVMFEILNSSLGDYMSSFELGHLMYSRKTEGMDAIDATKRLYWLLDYEFKRIALSQEVPEAKVKKIVNGTLFKKIQGGGDEMQARRNYDRYDTFFKLDTTFMMMGNHQIQFDSADVWERGLEFSSVYQFESQAAIDAAHEDTKMRLRLADDSIKANCSSVEWGNACLYLLMNYYKKTKVSIIRSADTDDEPLERSYITIAKEVFDWSDPTAVTLGSEIFAAMKYSMPEEQSFDKKKMIKELALANFHYKKCNIKTDALYGKWCFTGLKVILKVKEPENKEPAVTI
jgi:hypothetical protein